MAGAFGWLKRDAMHPTMSADSSISHDALGNPVSHLGAASLAAMDDFVVGFIACEARASRILDVQHDPAPMVQACCAAVQLFAESHDAPEAARAYIERVGSSTLAVTPRERRFIDAIAAWQRGDLDSAIALHHEQASQHPRDLASVKLGQYHCFNRGDLDGMLRLALAAREGAADVPYLHGMLAFGYEQSHRMREAEASARRAIAMERKEPWAHHALSHVMLTEGRLHEGLAFMHEVSDTWVGLNSFMVTHNWWHLALFLIDLDRLDEALAVYDERVWGVAKEYTQDQVNAVSLLARLELAGAQVGERWADVAQYLIARVDDHVLPFLDLQYLYGLARAGHHQQADRLMAGIEAHARDKRTPDAAAWQQVCVPAARGMLSYARGDFSEAAAQLGLARPQLVRIGGSHAQRDLFDQIHLEALMRAGTQASLGEALALLSPLVEQQPESVRLRRKCDAASAALQALASR